MSTDPPPPPSPTGETPPTSPPPSSPTRDIPGHPTPSHGSGDKGVLETLDPALDAEGEQRVNAKKDPDKLELNVADVKKTKKKRAAKKRREASNGSGAGKGKEIDAGESGSGKGGQRPQANLAAVGKEFQAAPNTDTDHDDDEAETTETEVATSDNDSVEVLPPRASVHWELDDNDDDEENDDQEDRGRRRRSDGQRREGRATPEHHHHHKSERITDTNKNSSGNRARTRAKKLVEEHRRLANGGDTDEEVAVASESQSESESGSDSGSQSDGDTETETETETETDTGVQPRKKNSQPQRQPYRIGHPSYRRDRRRSNSSSDSDSDSDSARRSDRHPGILTSLLGLYGTRHGGRGEEDRAERGENTLRQRLLRSRREGKKKKHPRRKTVQRRRRWDDNHLFQRGSRSSIESGMSETEPDTDGEDEDENANENEKHNQNEKEAKDESNTRTETETNTETNTKTEMVNEDRADSVSESVPERPSPRRIGTVRRSESPYRSNRIMRGIDRRRNRRNMKEDLNTPYIPGNRHDKFDPVQPSLGVSLAQTLKGVVQTIKLKDEDALDSRKGHFRTLAALVVTTSALAGAATPELAHYAPAFGPEAETNKGQRKLARYSNPEEDDFEIARQIEADTRQEAEERGISVEEMGLPEAQAQALLHPSKMNKRRRGKRRQREIKITKHISSVVKRQEFIEHLAKALVDFGAPSHSIESWLETTSDVLDIDASFIYFPSVLIVAFRDSDVHSTETLFIRPKGGLDLYRLSLVHKVYRKVAHDSISVNQGTRALRRIVKESKPYHWFTLLCAGATCSAAAAKVAFSGSFVDMLMSGVLGAFLSWAILFVMGRNRLVSNIFEIGTAGLLAFISRGLGGTGYFCYSSIVSGSIVLILPGWMICLGALELGSRNIVSGSIRVVWAIIYTLFLSFGIAIGSEIFDATGVEQPSADETSASGSILSTVTISGSFNSNNSMLDDAFRNGTFTFTNGTSASSTGKLACYRNPDLTAWWYVNPPDWTLLFLVPMFAFALGIWNRADWRSRDMVVMIIVASLGYLVSYFVGKGLPDQTDVQSAVAAFAIGIAGNIYSRLAGGSAFPSMVVGILLEVPNSIAAAGGLSISTSKSPSGGGDSMIGTSADISSTVVIAIRMVQTAVGLAVGLFAAALAVYPFGKGGYVFSF